MYENLSFKEYIGADKGPNRFWKLEKKNISKAERKLGYAFPEQLKKFFEEIGCGSWSQGTEDKNWNRGLINRIMGPLSIAGLLLDESEQYLQPPEGFNEGELPFMDLGEYTFLSVYPHSDKPNAVYWPSKTMISETLTEFLDKLEKHAGFYKNT